jgi:hypothetical protein
MLKVVVPVVTTGLWRVNQKKKNSMEQAPAAIYRKDNTFLLGDESPLLFRCVRRNAKRNY